MSQTHEASSRLGPSVHSFLFIIKGLHFQCLAIVRQHSCQYQETKMCVVLLITKLIWVTPDQFSTKDNGDNFLVQFSLAQNAIENGSYDIFLGPGWYEQTCVYLYTRSSSINNMTVT